MANSRKSGDQFEINLAKILIDDFNYTFYDTKSEEKFNKLKEKIITHDINLTKNKLLQLYQDLNLHNYNKLRFTTDNDGKKGNVSDFELFTNDAFIGFSLKKNNISIKHPRPSALSKQCNLNKDNTIKYKEDYMKCNNNWYDKIKHLYTFDKINIMEKDKMYLDFNNNTKKYLENLSSEEIITFWNFLIQYDKIHILKYDTKKQQLVLYNYLYLSQPKTIKSINVKGKHIIIIFDNGINLDLRLHNASKNITKSLSLKYDTKILNDDKLFTQTIYSLM
jgi:hypothetical protein